MRPAPRRPRPAALLPLPLRAARCHLLWLRHGLRLGRPLPGPRPRRRRSTPCAPCARHAPRPVPTRFATSGSDPAAWAWGRGPWGQGARPAYPARSDWWAGAEPAGAGAGPGAGRGRASVRAPGGRGRAAPAGPRPSQDGGGHARPWGRVCAAGGGGAAWAAGAAAVLARPSAPRHGRYLRLSPPCRYGSARGPRRGGAQQRPGLPDQAVDPRERPGHRRAYLLEPGEGSGRGRPGSCGASLGGAGPGPRLATPRVGAGIPEGGFGGEASEARFSAPAHAVSLGEQEGPFLLWSFANRWTTAEACLCSEQRSVSLANIVPRWPSVSSQMSYQGGVVGAYSGKIRTWRMNRRALL